MLLSINKVDKRSLTSEGWLREVGTGYMLLWVPLLVFWLKRKFITPRGKVNSFRLSVEHRSEYKVYSAGRD